MEIENIELELRINGANESAIELVKKEFELMESRIRVLEDEKDTLKNDISRIRQEYQTQKEWGGYQRCSCGCHGKMFGPA